MAKRRSDLINTDLFSDTSSFEAAPPPVAPANEIKIASKIANKVANDIADRFTNTDRTFSTYLDEGLILEIDRARTEIRQLTGKKPHAASKRMMVEAAIIHMLDDFWENGENSFVVNYIESGK